MPNWCDNSLTVEGEEKELRRFQEFAVGKGWAENQKEDTILDWNKFVPMPHDVVKNGYNGEGKIKGVAKGYDWENSNWGTKWGACECDVSEYYSSGKGSLVYNYQTAWSPGDGWFKAMYEMFPDLDFCLDFSEYGQGFKGQITASEGKQVLDEWVDIEPSEYHEMGSHEGVEDDYKDDCQDCFDYIEERNYFTKEKIWEQIDADHEEKK